MNLIKGSDLQFKHDSKLQINYLGTFLMGTDKHYFMINKSRYLLYYSNVFNMIFSPFVTYFVLGISSSEKYYLVGLRSLTTLLWI